jgi:hypothetical protein
MDFHRQIPFFTESKIEIYIYISAILALASGGSVATHTGPGSAGSPGAAAARTLGVKENTGMPGKDHAFGEYRGSGRVQSAPGEPSGWFPGGILPSVPAAGRNGALENLRSVISATTLPLAISALSAVAGTMGMVHPVLLTQMLVVACGAPCALQLLQHASHVLPAGNARNPTTSASELRQYPLFPWSDRGSPGEAAPLASARIPAGASPAGKAVRGTTGETYGHGGSWTTAKGHLCAPPLTGRKCHPFMYPPYSYPLH